MSQWRWHLLGLVLSAPLATATPQPADAIQAELTAAFGQKTARLIVRRRLPAMVVGVTDAQHTLWQRYGGTKLEQDAIKRNTRYHIGAITELVTTLAVLRLVESGHVALDTPIGQYDATLNPAVSALSLRQLLAHHSGLPLSNLHGAFGDQPRTDIWLPEVLAPTHEAELLHAYTPLGFQLAAHVMEQATGKAYIDIIADEVIAPLRLPTLGFVPRAGDAPGYRERQRQPQLYPRELAAQGVYASLDDMMIIARMLLSDGMTAQQSYLSSDAIAEVFTEQFPRAVLNLDQRNGLSSALNVGQYDVATLARWYAFGPNGTGMLLISPDRQLAAFAFTNRSDADEDFYDLLRDVVDTAVATKFDRARADRSRAPSIAPQWPAELQQQDDFAASYATTAGLVEFGIRDDGEYDLDAFGWRFRSRPYTQADGWFDVRYRLLGLVGVGFGPLKEVLLRPGQYQGRDLLLVDFRGRALFGGLAYQPPATVSPDWRARLGTYEIRNPDHFTTSFEIANIELALDGAALVARYEGKGFISYTAQIPLEIVDERTLRIAGVGLGLGMEVPFSDGSPARFTHSGYEFEQRLP